MNLLLVIVVLIILFGGAPFSPVYNPGWGYYPMGFGGILLILLVVLLLTGRL